MKAISLTQPWASSVVLDMKSVETRSWRTPHRGLLLVHAAKTVSRAFSEMIAEQFDLETRILRGQRMGREPIYPLGAIVGAVSVYDCRPVEDVRDVIELGELARGDYSDGRWAWLLHEAVCFPEPVPAKGSLGVWTVTDEAALRSVREQLDVCGLVAA
jgi:activating signal cointegrator 1